MKKKTALREALGTPQKRAMLGHTIVAFMKTTKTWFLKTLF